MWLVVDVVGVVGVCIDLQLCVFACVTLVINVNKNIPYSEKIFTKVLKLEFWQKIFHVHV